MQSIVSTLVEQHLTANFTRREPVGMDICIDRTGSQRLQNRVKAVFTAGEPLRRQREDLGWCNGALDRPRGAWTRRRERCHGRRSGIVRRLTEPDRDGARGVLLAEMEVRLVDELGADDRSRSGIRKVVR